MPDSSRPSCSCWWTASGKREASLLALGLLAGPPHVAARQAAGGPVTPAVPPQAFVDTFTFAEIGVRGQTPMHGPGASLTVFFGVPVTKIIS